MSEHRRLIADIGGTNARFALADPAGSIRDEWVRPVRAFPTFDAALGAYLESRDVNLACTSAAIAAAGLVSRNEIRLTNNDWHVSAEQLAAKLGANAKILLLNDLQAVALAIPFLSDEQVEFGDRKPPPLEDCDRMLAINVGTGFGAANLLRSGQAWTSCPSEAGHIILGAADWQELELFEQLAGTDLTIEDLLSGNGVQRIARHLRSKLGGTTGHSNDDAHRFDLTGGDSLSRAVSGLLTKFLARVCSNLTLASAAWDGVYISGSVASLWWQSADHSEFRRLFAGNSRMKHALACTPVGLITIEHPAFVGLANVEI